MPPGAYNPDNAGKFDAIKMPEQPKGPEKKGPNLEKLAELKAAAEARKAELQKKEAGLKAAEAPQVDAARQMAQELAVSGSPGKSFMEMSAADRQKLAADLLAENAERLEGNQAVARGDTSPKTVEAPDVSQYAGEFPALTKEQIRMAQEAQMKVVSPMSGSSDTMRVDRQPAQASAPAPKKKFLGLF